MEKYMIIDGERVSFTDEKNILAVIRKAGIILPTFCYYSDLSIYGACRMCIVEDEKTGKIDASFSMEPPGKDAYACTTSFPATAPVFFTDMETFRRFVCSFFIDAF